MLCLIHLLLSLGKHYPLIFPTFSLLHNSSSWQEQHKRKWSNMLYCHDPRLRHPTLIRGAQLHTNLSLRLTISFFMFTLCSYRDTHSNSQSPRVYECHPSFQDGSYRPRQEESLWNEHSLDWNYYEGRAGDSFFFPSVLKLLVWNSHQLLNR